MEGVSTEWIACVQLGGLGLGVGQGFIPCREASHEGLPYGGNKAAQGCVTRWRQEKKAMDENNQESFERKGLEDRLYLLARAVEQTAEGIAIVDLEGNLLFLNQSFARLHGYEQEELIGKHLSIFHTPEQMAQVEAANRQLRERGDFKGEIWHVRRDGQVFPTLMHNSLLRDDAGRPIGMIGTLREVSDLKRMEDQLRESEDRYRDLVEHSQELICTHDVEGRILSVNPWASKVLGYAQDALMQMNLRDILAPEVRDQFDAYLAEIKKHGAAQGLMMVQAANGEHRIWEYNNTLRAEGVKVPIVRGMAHDITEQKRAEEALRGAEKRYRSLFEEAPTMYVTTWNKEGVPVIADCNSQFLSTLGYMRAEVVQQPLVNFYTPASRIQLMDEGGYRRALEGCFGFEERELVARDGRVIHALLRAVPETDSQGRVSGTRAMYVDITARKRVEEALRASERQLRRVIESSPVSIIINQEGKYVYVNPACIKTFGYESAEEIVGRPIEDLFAPEEKEVMKEKARRRVAGEPAAIHYETVGLKKNGELFEVAAWATVVEYDGRPAVLAFCIDLSKEKKLRDQLLQAQKMEAVGRLAGGVAHDFNNLLTVIMGNADLMQMMLRKDSPIFHHVEEIAKAARRASSLTRQLLAFSRKQVLQPEIVDVNKVVNDMEKMLARLIGEDVCLSTDLEAGIGSVEIDPGQLEQVIMNLAVNARDAMPKGGGLCIRTSNVTLDEAHFSLHGADGMPGPYVLLEVADTGCGMNQAILGRAFEPFFTTKGKGTGTGLGLSTVYGIIKQSGGYIWAYSEPSKGASFKIYLPMVEGKEAEGDKQKEASIMPRGNETLLLVEDEVAVRKLVKKMLVSLGYKVLEAQNGEEAFYAVREYEGTIHMLLSDVVMPGMSGRELADRMKGLRSGMKVLLMSGYTDESIERYGVQDSGFAFMYKPFTPETLAGRIREELDKND